MVGSILFGSIADHFGRRKTIYISNILLFGFALARYRSFD
jgi:MFS family permease